MSIDGSFKEKHLWVKKATGLGITEFMLRMMAWLCTRDETFDGSQMCIVTGSNIEMATKLIKRMKGIFEPKLGLIFSNKETVLELNGCTMEAYPSNQIDSTEHWITRNSFCWMKHTSFEKANRKTLDMLLKDTSVNQIHIL